VTATAGSPSAFYRLLWQAIRNRQQIVCVYDALPREACPLVLGYTEDGDEAAAVYQIGGKSSQGRKLPGWRCFHLHKVRLLQARPGDWFEGDSHKQPQSCVRFVDVDANIPDTLTRRQPLPFGSPELRRPRGTG
jgi:hypothetical protein